MENDKEPLFTSDEFVGEHDHDDVVIQHKTPQNREDSTHMCSNNYQHRSPSKPNEILAMFVLASILALVLYLVSGNRVNCEFLLTIL